MPSSRTMAFLFLTVASFGVASAFAQDLPAIVVDPAIANMTADQKVEARQAAMKDDGRVLKGARDLTGDQAVTAATTVLQNMTNFPALFADGATNDKSEALPIVWQEFDKFTAIFDKGREDAEKLRVAAASGDTAAYAASLKALGQVCGECHQTYRKRD